MPLAAAALSIAFAAWTAGHIEPVNISGHLLQGFQAFSSGTVVSAQGQRSSPPRFTIVCFPNKRHNSVGVYERERAQIYINPATPRVNGRQTDGNQLNVLVTSARIKRAPET